MKNFKGQLEVLQAVHDYRMLDNVLLGMDPTRPALTKEQLKQWPPAPIQLYSCKRQQAEST